MRNSYSLTLIAGMTLLLELALIRWIPTAIYQVAFFTNFVLLSAFIGIGVGFLLVDDTKKWFLQTPFALFALMALSTLSRIELNVRNSEEINFGPQTQAGVVDYLLIALVFILATWVFVCLGNGIAHAFRKFGPIKAYSFDILGSIIGIVIFSVLSLVWSPAFVWFSCFSVGYFFFVKEYDIPHRTHIVALIACVLLSTNPSTWIHSDDFTWTPYQLISVFKDKKATDEYHVMANLVPHQIIFRHGDNQASRSRQEPFELMKKIRKSDFKRVLIVGSGSGVDVVQALKNGATEIDAVEIDPGIAQTARRFNKDRPFDDPRVNQIIDDGRGVIQRAKNDHYDLVIFARTDSLVRYSGSSLRLESFLFTLESFQDVKRVLKPDGVFLLYNAYHSESVQHRIAAMLDQTFDRPPISKRIGSGTEAIMLAGETISDGNPIDFDNAFVKELPTDDWPFLYLKSKSIPFHYYLAIFFSLFVTFAWITLARKRAPLAEPQIASYPVGFFFMGVAFLLLESSSIVQFTILFGTTWVVNSVVFLGVLVLVLLANILVQTVKPKFGSVYFFYVLLFATLACSYFIRPPQLLDFSNPWIRGGLAVLLYLGPIFVANIIFSMTLMQSESGTRSFSWNLVGTVVGGCLEYVSIVTGYRNLVIIVAVAYLLVLIFTVKDKKKKDALESNS